MLLICIVDLVDLTVDFVWIALNDGFDMITVFLNLLVLFCDHTLVLDAVNGSILFVILDQILACGVFDLEYLGCLVDTDVVSLCKLDQEPPSLG